MKLRNRFRAHLQVKISATAKDMFPFLYRVGILKPSSLQHYIQTHLANAERTRVQPVVFTFHVLCTQYLSTFRREKRQLSQQVCRVFEDSFPRLRSCSRFYHEKTAYIWYNHKNILRFKNIFDVYLNISMYHRALAIIDSFTLRCLIQINLYKKHKRFIFLVFSSNDGILSLSLLFTQWHLPYIAFKKRSVC